MEKSTIKALGKGLKQERRIPEDLPFPIQKALQALSELPEVSERQAETPHEASNGTGRLKGS